MTTSKLTRYAMVITITICLNILLGSFSFGIIQIRLSEVLLVLCLFDKGYIYPLTIGCLLSNVIGFSLGLSVLPLDFIFGTLATLISCLLMIKLKGIIVLNRPLVSLLVPTIINGAIIGFELALYFAPSSELVKYLFIYGGYVFLGEIISVTVLGFILYGSIENFLHKLDKH